MGSFRPYDRGWTVLIETADESLRQAAKKTLIAIVDYAPYPTVAKIFGKVSSIPQAQYTEDNLKFYAHYTRAVFANINRRHDRARRLAKSKSEGRSKDDPSEREANEENYELYDLNVLWKSMLSAHGRLHNLAMGYLIQVLVGRLDITHNYFCAAVNGIDEGKEETLVYLQFLEELYREGVKSEVITKHIKPTLDSDDFFARLFSLFINYQTLVAKTVREHKEIKDVINYVKRNEDETWGRSSFTGTSTGTTSTGT